jgi:hypothetical protein
LTQSNLGASHVGGRPCWPLAPTGRRGLVGAATALVMGLSSTAGEAAPPQSPAPGDGASAARSGPSRDECLTAHRTAQELKQSGKFVEAGQQLLICSSATCPGPVISDCGGWISELEEATPTIVFEIEADGKEATEAKVFVDQQPVTDWSHAVKLNPGRHAVRVELPPFEPHEENVFAAEGHRMRLVPVKFASSKPKPPPVVPEGQAVAPGSDEERRPVPAMVYPLLGVGVAGLAGFGVFAGIGRGKQNGLEKTCGASPAHCSESDLGPMKTMYLIGDVSLGVGAAALVGAAIVYLTRPAQRVQAAPVVSLDVGPVGGGERRNRSWGASATVTW